jgi:hypothetical protein
MGLDEQERFICRKSHAASLAYRVTGLNERQSGRAQAAGAGGAEGGVTSISS